MLAGVACTGSGAEGGPTRVELSTDEPLSLEIPAGWTYVELGPQGHFVGLRAATSSDIVERAWDERGGPNPIRAADLSPVDAFVQVIVVYGPPFGGREKRTPRNLCPGGFVERERLLGSAVRECAGKGRDDGVYYVRYWTGPAADASTAGAATDLAESIRAQASRG